MADQHRLLAHARAITFAVMDLKRPLTPLTIRPFDAQGAIVMGARAGSGDCAFGAVNFATGQGDPLRPSDPTLMIQELERAAGTLELDATSGLPPTVGG